MNLSNILQLRLIAHSDQIAKINLSRKTVVSYDEISGQYDDRDAKNAYCANTARRFSHLFKTLERNWHNAPGKIMCNCAHTILAINY